ncbi:MAG: hypothetical protein PHE25_02610 [Candidatus Gracilibacteria bacterium]|nr:hypothetical protein [Candidatus Gracilibacteria bacterium]
MAEIKLNSIGVLKQDIKFLDWWKSEEISVPYFENQKIQFVIEKKLDEDNAIFDNVISNFLKLNEKDKLKISKYAYESYKDFVNIVGEDEFNFVLNKQEDIRKYIHPYKIYITKRRKDGLVYLSINTNCDWEEEHGLQIVYKNGNEIVRVGPIDGHLLCIDAYGDLSRENKICG